MLNFLLLQAAETTAKTSELSLMGMVSQGGIIMIPIVFLLFVTIFITAERVMKINQMAKVSKQLVKAIGDGLNSGNLKDAQLRCEQEGTSLGRILSQGVRGVGRPMSEIDSNMEDAAAIEISTMEVRLGWLGIIAGIAPMLGFIGTIAGVIHIFYDIAQAGDISIGTVSSGLYEKMITSGAGLIVGVLAYTCLHLLQGRVDKFILEMQKEVLQFKNMLQS